jgi:hypothetical protein
MAVREIKDARLKARRAMSIGWACLSRQPKALTKKLTTGPATLLTVRGRYYGMTWQAYTERDFFHCRGGISRMVVLLLRYSLA